MTSRSRASKFLLLLAIAAPLLSGCPDRMMTRPTVTIEEVHITGLSLAGATLTFVVELENPNGFGMTVTAFSYTIYLNDRAVANGAAAEPISIDRHSVTKIPLPLKTSFTDLAQELQSLNRSDPVEYRIEGSLSVRSILGRMAFPYVHKGTIGGERSRTHPAPEVSPVPSTPGAGSMKGGSLLNRLADRNSPSGADR